MKLSQKFSFLIIFMILCFSKLSSTAHGQAAEICVEPPIRNVKGYRDFEVCIWIRLIPDPGLTYISLVLMWNPALMKLHDSEILLPEGWEVMEEISGEVQNKQYFFIKLQEENKKNSNSFNLITCDREWLHLTFRCEGTGTSAIEISKNIIVNSNDETKIIGTELRDPLQVISYNKFDCSIKQFEIVEKKDFVTPESKSKDSTLTAYLVLIVALGIITIIIIKRKMG
ncbi:hypothetical protein [[Eubacterium] cellulosolvens]